MDKKTNETLLFLGEIVKVDGRGIIRALLATARMEVVLEDYLFSSVQIMTQDNPPLRWIGFDSFGQPPELKPGMPVVILATNNSCFRPYKWSVVSNNDLERVIEIANENGCLAN